MGYINKTLRKNFLIILILILASAFRLYKIGRSFPFDYDQAIPAQSAYDFFVNHKISLIGQELSFPGFYLGPIHNWFQYPIYFACNLAPDCAPYFFMFISLLITALTLLIVNKIFKKEIAAIVTLIYAVSFTAISFERGVNSNYFLFLSSLLLTLCLYEYFNNKDKYLITGSFIAGLATVNFNPVFIFSTFAFYLGVIFRGKLNYKIVLLSLFAFFINYLPLLIFNIRHDNIFFHNLVNFATTSAAHEDFTTRISFLIFKVFIPFNTFFIFHNTNILLQLIFVSMFIFSAFKVIKNKNKFHRVLLIWPLVVIAGFTLYRGHVPDYYFQQSTLAILVLISMSLEKKALLIITFVVILSYLNLREAIKSDYAINYQLKKRVIDFIIQDSNEQTFNVYYNMPPGINTGYSTLFKLKRHEPQENQKYLYIIDSQTSTNLIEEKYVSFYPKNVSVKTFDSFLRVVSVK